MARDLRVQLILDTINKASAPLKAITRDGGKTADALKAAQEQLQALKQQQRDISSFRKLESATRDSSNALREQQQKAAALARELKSTANPTKKLQREFEQASAAARKLKTAHQGNQHKLQQLSQQLRQSGIHTDRLDRHQNSLQRQMRQANGIIDEQKQKLAALADQQKRLNAIKAKADKIRGNAMTLTGHSAAALGGGTLALRGMGGMMAPVVQAQAGGSLIAARQGQDSTQAEGYTDIINAIKADGSLAEVGEIANALDGAASAFGRLGETSAAELQRIARHALHMSSAFGTDTNQSIQMAQLMLKNGLASSADEAFDLITSGMQNVTAEMRGELPDILHEYSTHFRGMGFNGQEAMSLLVQMAGQGRYALDKTGDAIKEFSIRGSDMSKASVEAYELIGLNAHTMSGAIATGGDDAQKALQATVKGLLELTDPAERANAAVALFGTPVEDLAIDKIPDFLEALGGAKDVLGETTGAADRLGKTLHEDLNGDFGKLTGAWHDLKTQLFEKETGALRELVQSLSSTVRLVTAWVKENPELAAWLVRIAAITATVVTVLGALGLAASTVMFGISGLMKMAPLLGMFKALGPVLLTLGKIALPLVAGGIKAITAALIANPIGLIIAAIAAAAYLIYRNWEPIKAFFASLWQQVKAAFDGGIAGVTALLINWSPIGLLYKGIRAGLSQLGIEMPAQLSEVFSKALSAAGQLLLNWNPISLMYTAIQKGLGLIGIELPAKFSEFGGNLIQGLINGLTGGITQVKDKITNIAASVSGWFKEKLGIHSPSRVFAAHGGDVMGGLQQGLGDGEGGVLERIAGISNRLLEKGRELAGKLRSALGNLKNSAFDKLKAAGGWLGEQLGFNDTAAQPAFAGAGGIQLDNRPALQPRQAAPASNSLSIGEIHVHAAPGMDEHAVARLVAVEVQRLHEQQLAATRSHFSDED
ncbi:phage tail tape measure protein [Marinobacterium iners]|uniref:Phage tail tape measure protein, TP901 family, core region n=1 Tax=Marinobacterium iners DSM 11526 TaxID=1122198 RepID=A0A1H3ZXL3_9GAMM|nr:phage tail tape measure protein [Marinobacterium iners]SEA28493.1 phage tail tape measure protein, TP901 family, core region [Marinobacterium iners DSM 11526]